MALATDSHSLSKCSSVLWATLQTGRRAKYYFSSLEIKRQEPDGSVSDGSFLQYSQRSHWEPEWHLRGWREQLEERCALGCRQPLKPGQHRPSWGGTRTLVFGIDKPSSDTGAGGGNNSHPAQKSVPGQTGHRGATKSVEQNKMPKTCLETGSRRALEPSPRERLQHREFKAKS